MAPGTIQKKRSPMLIHVVDDDEPVRGSLELLLRSVGHQVQTFASASAFLHALDRAAPACLILDLNMPGVDGAELSELLARQGHRFPVIVQTAAPHSPLVERAWRSGVLAVVEKPPSIDRLLELIDRVEGMRRGAAVRPFAESPPRPGVYQTGLQGDSLAELSGCLASLRWPMSGFTHSDACLAAIDRDTPDCIVCDIDTAQGAALARALAQYSEVPCIALCGDRRSGLAKGLAALERLDGSWMLVDKASPGQLEKSIIQALLSWLGKPPRRLYAAIEPLYPDSDAESLAEQKTSDLVLTPELNVSAMSKNYAQVAMISRYDHLGRNLFEVFQSRRWRCRRRVEPESFLATRLAETHARPDAAAAL